MPVRHLLIKRTSPRSVNLARALSLLSGSEREEECHWLDCEVESHNVERLLHSLLHLIRAPFLVTRCFYCSYTSNRVRTRKMISESICMRGKSIAVKRSILRPANLLFLIGVVALVFSLASTPAGAAELQSDQPDITPVLDTSDSNVGRAHALLQSQGKRFTLIIVSRNSTELEGEIHRDLQQRGFRATAGPDEGFDTRGESCYPGCVYVRIQDVNVISVYAWARVLQHEYRHIIQATNNPRMAQDFRNSDGVFTPYAAFSEACADYELNVARMYRARQRIDQVKRILGDGQESLVNQACNGYMRAYVELVDLYNENIGRPNAFEELFRPYL